MSLDDGSLSILGASVLSRSIHPSDHASAIGVSELGEARFSRQEVETSIVEPIDAILNLLNLILEGSPAISHVPGMLLANCIKR